MGLYVTVLFSATDTLHVSDLATFLVAWYSEEYSSRKAPFLVGLFALISSLTLFMEAPNYPIMVLARFLGGVSAACLWVIGLSLLCVRLLSVRVVHLTVKLCLRCDTVPTQDIESTCQVLSLWTTKFTKKNRTVRTCDDGYACRVSHYGSLSQLLTCSQVDRGTCPWRSSVRSLWLSRTVHLRNPVCVNRYHWTFTIGGTKGSTAMGTRPKRS